VYTVDKWKVVLDLADVLLITGCNCEVCYSQKLNQTTNMKVDNFIFKCMRYQLWFAMQLELFLCVTAVGSCWILTHCELTVVLVVLIWLCQYFNYFIRPWPHSGSDKGPTGSSSYLPSQTALPFLTHPRLADNKDLSQSQRNISGEATVLIYVNIAIAMEFLCCGVSHQAVFLDFVLCGWDWEPFWGSFLTALFMCVLWTDAAISQLAVGFVLAIMPGCERAIE